MILPIFALELVTTYMPIAVTALIGASGYLINKSFTTEANLKAHAEVDSTMFNHISNTLSRLEQGQKDASTKLENFIERTHDASDRAVVAAFDIKRAATNALEVVEAARLSALQVVASAAALAVKKE